MLRLSLSNCGSSAFCRGSGPIAASIPAASSIPVEVEPFHITSAMRRPDAASTRLRSRISLARASKMSTATPYLASKARAIATCSCVPTDAL
jgi:hypothetical protein